MAPLCPNYANGFFVRIISFWNWKTPLGLLTQSYDFYSQGKDGPEWKSFTRGLASLQLQLRVLCVTAVVPTMHEKDTFLLTPRISQTCLCDEGNSHLFPLITHVDGTFIQ